MEPLVKYIFPNGPLSIKDVTGALPKGCRLPVSYAHASFYQLPEGSLLIQHYTHLLFHIEVLEFNLDSELIAEYALRLSSLFLFCMLKGGVSFHTPEGKAIYQAFQHTCYGTFNHGGKYGYRLGPGTHQIFFMIPNEELVKANADEYSGLLELLESMERNQDRYGHMPECAVEGKFFQLLTSLLSYTNKPGRDIQVILFKRGKALLWEYHRMVIQRLNQIVYQVKSYLEQNYAKSEISGASIAEVFKISKRTLSRVFKAEFNVSTYAHLINIRLENAKTLLHEQHLRVNEVYRMVGYKDQRSFRSQFHKKFGYPPSDSY